MTAKLGIHRRDFLKAGTATGLALALGDTATAAKTATADSAIILMLTGGPSQIDTWDPKPDAPSSVRGPFATIRTKVPGLQLSELFPRMAAISDRFSLIRTMHHTDAPIHENGIHLLNTGHRRNAPLQAPSIGSVLSWMHGEFTPKGHRRYYVAPSPKVETGLDLDLGFGAGFLGDRIPYPDTGFNFRNDVKSFDLENFPSRDERYGMTPFGQNCVQALRSVSRDAGRVVVVNMYSTVFHSASWDCHADDTGSLRTDLHDYAHTVAPTFDSAFSSLIQDLQDQGKLDSTLVVAVGEFGRTPKLNCNGGRDHWSNCWTAIVAGGGIRGGQVIGSSDAFASEPRDRPVHCAELVATIYHALGIPTSAIIPGPDGTPTRVVDAQPVLELF